MKLVFIQTGGTIDKDYPQKQKDMHLNLENQQHHAFWKN